MGVAESSFGRVSGRFVCHLSAQVAADRCQMIARGAPSVASKGRARAAPLSDAAAAAASAAAHR